jgi:hypothetical protein
MVLWLALTISPPLPGMLLNKNNTRLFARQCALPPELKYLQDGNQNSTTQSTKRSAGKEINFAGDRLNFALKSILSATSHSLQGAKPLSRLVKDLARQADKKHVPIRQYLAGGARGGGSPLVRVHHALYSN